MLGQHEEAQKLYRAGLTYKADDINILTNFGLSLSFSGKHDEGIKILRKLVESPHATAHHRQNLALALGLAGRKKEAAGISRMDLDDRSVRANLTYYSTLRALSDPAQRVQAVHARHQQR